MDVAKHVNQIQRELLEMYKDVKTVLDGHGIRFYVHFGSALGALRHDGFIPWDDDIDIAVWAEDVPVINKVLAAELDHEKYYYHIPSADTHPHVIARHDDLEGSLRNRDAPFIDLFPISKFPSGKIRKSFYWLLTWGNVGSVWAIDHIRSFSLHRMLRWIPSFFGKLAEMTVDKDSELTTIVSTEFMDYIFPKAYYGEPVMHVFEDTEVPLPAETDKILTHMFGDYMTPPPEDERTGAGGFPCSAYKDYKLYGDDTGWEE